MWAVTSLRPQKVVSKSQIYSARAKLKLNSDQARDLVKNCFEGRSLCVPFKTAPLHPGSWINRLCLCGESESYWERAIWWYFARIKSRNIVLGCLWMVLSVPQTWLNVWFPEVVDRQISGMSWRSCYNWRILCKCWAPPPPHDPHTHLLSPSVTRDDK